MAWTQEGPPVAVTVTWKFVEWTEMLAALGEVVDTVMALAGAVVEGWDPPFEPPAPWWWASW